MYIHKYTVGLNTTHLNSTICTYVRMYVLCVRMWDIQTVKLNKMFAHVKTHHNHCNGEVGPQLEISISLSCLVGVLVDPPSVDVATFAAFPLSSFL